MNETTLELDKTYSESQVESIGLIPRETKHISSKVFVKNSKIYFFEDLKNSNLRLFSIINEKSFFL